MRPLFVAWAALLSATAWGKESLLSDSRTSAPIWVIDEFVSDEGKVRYEGGISYGNYASDSTKGYTRANLQLTPTLAVPVVSGLDTEQRQTDQLVGMLGIRYGITENNEIGLRTTGSWSHTQTYSDTTGDLQREQRFSFSSLSANLSTRIYRGGSTSAFAFGSLGIADRLSMLPFRPKTVYLHSVTMGLSGYLIDDPVVMSLTASTTLKRPVDFEGKKYQLGTSFTVAPAISFLANDRVTLSSGLQFSYQIADRFAGRKLNLNESQIHMTLGAGYALNERISLYGNFLTKLSGTSGDNSAQLSFMYEN